MFRFPPAGTLTLTRDEVRELIDGARWIVLTR